MIFNPIRLLVFGLVTLASLHSEAIPVANDVRFCTVGINGSPADLYYEYKGENIRLPVTESSRSVLMSFAGSPAITFYRLIPGADNKLIKEVVAEVDITSAGPRPLLVFIPNPTTPKGYRVLALADDLKSFYAPWFKFVNLSGVPLNLNLGDGKATLRVEGTVLLNPRLASSDQPEARFMTIQDLSEKPPRVRYSNNWGVRPTERTLVFISFDGDQLKILQIVDDGSSEAAVHGEDATR